MNLPIVLCFSSILLYILYPFFHTFPHTFLQILGNVIFYSLVVEFFYYLYHRIIHTSPFYKMIHSIHHENIHLYPIDSLYFDMIDICSYILCLHLPILFIPLSFSEFFTGICFYVTMGYLSHSHIIYDHHRIHHKLFKWNYCLVFPIFDLLGGTYRETFNG